MQILIVEDEQPAAKRLANLLRTALPTAEILPFCDSVDRAVDRLRRAPGPDLIFLDIQLADDLCFDIFRQVDVKAPVIFATAYDQYTLQAFKLNSIDYLLKPIDPAELDRALEKFRRFFGRAPRYDNDLLQQIARQIQEPSFKQRFLVKSGQQITYLKVAEIRYFFSEEGIVYARTEKGKRHHIDYTLDQLSDSLNPAVFFRINRKVITSVDAIGKIAPYFHSRLILELRPPADFEVIVSRDRVGAFKNWLDR